VQTIPYVAAIAMSLLSALPLPASLVDVPATARRPQTGETHAELLLPQDQGRNG
jgi:hypothetical protein